MAMGDEIVQRVKVHFDNRDYGQLTQVMNQALGRAHQTVQEELEIQIENLKNEAIKQFDQELYSECLRSFQFLCELEPQNHTFRDYLELCRQIIGEAETSQGRTDPATAYRVFEEVNQELKNSPESSEIPLVFSRDRTRVDPTPVPSRGETSAEESLKDGGCDPAFGSDIHKPVIPNARGTFLANGPGERNKYNKPSWPASFLRRSLRVSVLVVAILLMGVILSLWTRRVRAPHSPDGPGNETVSEQIQDPQQRVVEPTKSQGTGSEGKRKEASEAVVRETPGSGGSAQDQLQETSTYPVIHEHLFGNCQGELRISRQSVAYVPLNNPKDKFNYPFTDILNLELSDTLKIEFRNRTYRFKASPAKNKKSNRATLKAIHQQLAKTRTEAK